VNDVEKPRAVGVFGLLFGLVFVALVVLAPALGVWAGSSLAAYRNGPVWLAALAGLLLFPILPLLWERRATARRQRRGKTGPRLLTAGGRLVLRTLVVNLVFLAALVARFPDATFAALATRGDWFLDGREGPQAAWLRERLFASAGRLEWVYRLARKNPYQKDLDPEKRPTPVEEPQPAPVATARQEEKRPSFGPDGTPVWPWPDELHPLVAQLPASIETDYRSVARYLAENETNPWLRVKALHDYVADRVSYDVEAYRSGSRPPQDAETVFRTRRAVCAGYARLLAAMGEAAGDEIRLVPGDARLDGSDLTGEGHAWNVAKVGIRWVLLDATWDAGHVGEKGFTKEYKTDYLFTPPDVFGVTHHPAESAWQLRETPLARGEFFRQPMMRAGFFADGLELVSPDRSQVTVPDAIEVRLRNPRGRFLLGKALGPSGEVGCEVTNGAEPLIGCKLDREGTYRLRLFSGPERVGSYDMVGELEVLARGK